MNTNHGGSAIHHTYILITGANSGLGFGTCCRLLDKFLDSRSPTDQLTLIFTTRDQRKGDATLKRLKIHLSKHKLVRPHLPLQNPRIFFRPESLELTSLLSIRALTQRLLKSAIPHLDAVILNAGISGAVALNWPQALWKTSSDLVQATTWPTYKIAGVGWLTGTQLPALADGECVFEPVLGEIFCANVLGHYMLAHWLMPLLRSCPPSQPGRVVWVSSVEPGRENFDAEDFQALKSRAPYEHTKRLTDLLALTSRDQMSTSKSVASFIDCPNSDRRFGTSSSPPSTPTVHVAHPGICATTIVPIPWIMQFLMLLSFWVARLVGSPWHVISPYSGAGAMVWLALAERETIQKRESGGMSKWGSAVKRWGGESVQMTEIEGWGFIGDGGEMVWWEAGGWGRKRGARDAKAQDVEGFVEQGAKVWREMEELRTGWEKRIDEWDKKGGKVGA